MDLLTVKTKRALLQQRVSFIFSKIIDIKFG